MKIKHVECDHCKKLLHVPHDPATRRSETTAVWGRLAWWLCPQCAALPKYDRRGSDRREG